ncbi:MAG: thiolase C-terminal domain-containing protein [Candidatus Freyarchaeota archaeon]
MVDLTKAVAVIGIGQVESKPLTPDRDFRELIYTSAKKAYEDAGVAPDDVDALLTNEYDFYAGISIADEYTPDQVGCRLKFDNLVCNDGTIAFINAYMLILSGIADVVVVESHSKVATDVKNYPEVLLFALDPIYNRPLGGHPYYLAGMDMTRYICDAGATREQIAEVVVKNKGNALLNPSAGFGARLTVDDVICSRPAFWPINELDIAPLADYSAVVILASEDVARAVTDTPVWVIGVGHATDSSYPESWSWGEAIWVKNASKEAFTMAGIRDPKKQVNIVEVTEAFSYQEPQYLEAMGICKKGEAPSMVEEFYIGGRLPVNASGGCLGMGYAPQAAGLQRIVEVVQQLRQQAGRRQVDNAEVGVAVGSDSEIVKCGGVVVLAR